MVHEESLKREVSVIFPTYNERDNIGPLIQETLKHTPANTEVIVVDDNSPDLTWQVVEEMAKAQKNITLLRRIGKKGLVSALIDGIAFSKGEIVVWSDCDFSMPPEKIKDLLQGIARGYDLVVGSRFIQGGGKEIITGSSDSVLAFLMSRTLNCFLQTFLGQGFKDWTSGFIAIRRKVLEEIPLKGDYGEYFIDLVYRAIKLSYKVIEIPYLNKARSAGTSKTGGNFFDYIKKGWKYVWLASKLKFTRIKRDKKG